ncbi:MAG: acyl-ACP--UDP-N-acetylglucosamine O-acyltransferase [Gammaproteobacteria bacterium]|nr:acyl-ACP--UDP-N-acetylglucosamine O-acyltransferase [Gammaproteobacteria bacterium]
MIHPTAIIDPKASLASDVEVGPYAVIGPRVSIDSGSWIGPHAVIKGPCTLGKNSQIFQFASVGECPQDKKFAGEDTELIMGDGNVVRESATIHRGTIQDSGKTVIGSHNLFMAYTHVAHDCVIGDHVIMSNTATLAGHVTVGDHAIISAFCAIHQFARIGAHAFISHGALLSKDVPPYVMVAGMGGTNVSVYGINSEGLKRRGFSAEDIETLRQAYKIIYRQGLRVVEAIEELKALEQTCSAVSAFREFLEQSTRGIVR